MKFLYKLTGEGARESINPATTSQMYLGLPEAEGEIGGNAKIQLTDVFEDHFGVLSDLRTPKFIVTGRKGSGKSAIGEYITLKAIGNPDVFVESVRKSDVDLERLLQIASPLGADVHAGILLEWVILVKLAGLIVRNVAFSDDEPTRNLSKFFERNRGLISLNALDFKSIVSSHNGEVAIELFARAAQGLLGRRPELKVERTPFYRLIPHLKDVIIALLDAQKLRDNHAEYFVIFDDLDIGLNVRDDAAMLRLGELIRLCRDYNKFFSKHKTTVKIVVLLRDDIAVAIGNREADLGKIIHSYESRITWWGTKLFGPDENNSEIKKFITKRITIAFNRKKLAVNTSDAWDRLVYKDSNWGENRTSFKYLLDHTLYRPRDLILMFLDIDKLNLLIPLNKSDFDETILPKYASRLLTEWRNELLFVLPSADVNAVISELPRFSSIRSPFNGENFTEHFRAKLSSDPLTVLSHLFTYSIVGHIDWNQRVFFTHRQDPSNPIIFDPSAQFTFHKAVVLAARSKYSGF